VDHAGAVRGGERIGNLNRNLHPLCQRQCASIKARGKRLAFQILQHEEVDALVMADIMKRADVRVIQRRDCARFSVEAFAELRIRGECLRQNLDGDRPIQTGVPRPVDLAHSARAQGSLDFIRAETSARGQTHSSVNT